MSLIKDLILKPKNTIISLASSLMAIRANSDRKVFLDYDGGSNQFAFTNTTQTYTKAQQVATVTLTDAATIATDASLSNVFKVTLGGNRTLGNPTNLIDGATYIWRITQDGTGSRTLAYGSAFKFAGGTAPTLTTTAGAIDILSGISDGTNVYASLQKGFA